MVALSRNVTRKHAMEMLLTGDMVPAADAARIGLVNRVVKPGEERAAALALAKKIAGEIGAYGRHRQGSASIGSSRWPSPRPIVTSRRSWWRIMMARDAEEGICAFIEKRDPTWEDR